MLWRPLAKNHLIRYRTIDCAACLWLLLLRMKLLPAYSNGDLLCTDCSAVPAAASQFFGTCMYVQRNRARSTYSQHSTSLKVLLCLHVDVGNFEAVYTHQL